MEQQTIQLVMTAHDRPELCVAAIKSLNYCTNSNNIVLDIFHEPTKPSVGKVCWFIQNNHLNFKQIKVHVNSDRYGWTRNSLTALTYGFERSEYVVLVEDDQLFARDFIEMHEYFRDEYAMCDNVFTASAGHYTCNKTQHDRKLDYSYTSHNFFHNQGWGTWINRWEEMKNNWENFETFDDEGRAIKNYNHDGWDWKMQNVVMGDRVCMVPFLSRVHNVGMFGAHCGVYKWEKNIKLSHWAGDYITKTNNTYSYRDVNNPDETDIHYFIPTNQPTG